MILCQNKYGNISGRQTKSENTDKNKPIEYPNEVSTKSIPDNSKTSMALEHFTSKKVRIDLYGLDVLIIE